jgi:hypothetical protein
LTPRIPDQIVLKRDRDLARRRGDLIARRALFALVLVIPVLALLNVFGQRPTTSRVESAAASLKVVAPAHVRGGLIYMARFHIVAHRELKKATLVLEPGWLESLTINTMEPSPVGEASDNGRLTLDLGHIPAGTSHLFFMDVQVNPTNVGRRSQDVALYDGDTKLLEIHRTITIFP